MLAIKWNHQSNMENIEVNKICNQNIFFINFINIKIINTIDTSLLHFVKKLPNGWKIISIN
jgi:hypothetical protein